MVRPESQRMPALLCALLTGIVMWWLIGQKLVLVTDEGIYLDGARRIVAGQVPYRDFFVLTGPGHFWNLALLFRVFGLSLASARLMLVFDLALMAGCMFWLAARLSSRMTAGLVVFVFLGLLSVNAPILVVGHRWDSSAAALAGIVLAWAGLERRTSIWFVGAGLVAAYAAWITPSLLVVVIALAGWLMAVMEGRRFVLHFLAGVTLMSAAAAGLLAWQGALLPMVQHLLWSSTNYVGVNRVPYGHMPGGYGLLLKDATGADWLVRVVVLFFYSLAPLLPIFALGWLALLRREALPVSLLLCCGGALVLSTYPRWEIEHLTFISPLFYVLAGALLPRILPPRLLSAFAMLFAIAAFTFFIAAGMGRWQAETLETTRGRILGSRADLDVVQKILQPLPRGSSVFMYVYLPTLYFFADAVNPTRYSFLQPGMMTEDDQRSAVADLKRLPPLQVINGRMSENEMQRIWPGSDPSKLKFAIVDDWLERYYAPDPARRGVIEVWLPKGP